MKHKAKVVTLVEEYFEFDADLGVHPDMLLLEANHALEEHRVRFTGRRTDEHVELVEDV